MEIENLLIQIAEQSSSDHPGCKQGPGEGAADIGPHASAGQRGDNTPVAISRPKGKKSEKSHSSAFPSYLVVLQVFLQMKNILQCSSNHPPPVLQEILFIRAQVKPQASI